jgi:peroxiredoxin Q/BCP
MALLLTGSPAPDFIVNDQNGEPFHLGDYRGKKVVLYFYPKDLTEACTNQACSLRDNYCALLNKGYTIVGISSNDEKTHRKFIAREKLPFLLLADVDKHVHHLYGTWIEKQMYGRHFMGTARVTYIINEEGIITDVIEKVDTKNHAAQILGEPIPPKSRAKSTAQKRVVKAKGAKNTGSQGKAKPRKVTSRKKK